MKKVCFGKVIFFLIIALFLMISNVFSYVPKASAYSGNDYDYEFVYQSPYPSTLGPNEKTNVSIEVRNTGNKTWSNNSNPVRMGSGSVFGSMSQQRDYDSEFYSTDWLSPNRPANSSEELVLPGSIATYHFDIKAPSKTGHYKAYFTPVIDGLMWMEDIGIYWEITVEGDGDQINISEKENTPSNQDISTNTFDSRDILSTYSKSVAKLYCKKDANIDHVTKGSGTLLENTTNIDGVSDYYIMTNLHVAETRDNSTSKCIIQMYADYRNINDYILFESTGYRYYGENIDFAFLEPEIIDYSDPEIQKFKRFINLDYSSKHMGTQDDLETFSMKNTGIMDNEIEGDDVLFALGYPGFGGEDITLTTGVILGLRDYNNTEYIRSDAEVGPGFSGGLVINDEGEIIGIPTMMIKKDTGNLSLILHLYDLELGNSIEA